MTISLEDALRKGGAELKKLRRSKQLAVAHVGATLVDIKLAGGDLSGLQLIGTEWEGCVFEGTSFVNADLSNCLIHRGVFLGCDFTGTDFSGASIEHALFSRCNFSGVKGWDTVEQDDVELDQVHGLSPPPRRERVPGEPLSLPDKLPNYYELPLEQLVDRIAEHATVTRGALASDADIARLEATFEIAFPDDYRRFLQTIGQLTIVGDPSYGFGTLEVYGSANLEQMRERWRAEFEQWCGPGWADFSPDGPAADPDAREKLRDELALEDEYIAAFQDDGYDMLRIAHRYMVPIMATPDELHRVATCAGPGGRLYTVSIKDNEIEPPRGTFLSRLLDHLEGLIVADR